MVLVVATVVAAGAAAAAPPMLVAADGEHAWIVIEESPVEQGKSESSAVCQVVHFTAAEGPEKSQLIIKLPRWPEAITSLDRQLWLVFPPMDALVPSRDVVSLRIEHDPAKKRWFPIPSGHLEVLASLPREATFTGIVATDGGLFAVVHPKDAPQELLVLGPTTWKPVGWEASFDPSTEVVLGRAASVRGRALVIGQPQADRERIFVWDAVEWTTHEIASDNLPLRGFVAVDGGSIAVRANNRNDAVLGYLREGGRVAPLAEVSSLAASWQVVSMVDGPWVVDRKADQYRLRHIAPIVGTVGEPRVVTIHEGGVDWLQWPLAGMAIVAFLIVVLFMRPFIERAVSDPSPTLRPLPVMRRVAGLIFDLIPGAVIVMVAFKLTPDSFAESFVSIRADDALPALIVIFVLVVHTGISEVVWGTSLGKRMVGGKVVALDGLPATRLQRALRVAAKAVVLLLPLMGLLVFLDPLHRGLPELVSRTVVVVARRPADVPREEDSAH